MEKTKQRYEYKHSEIDVMKPYSLGAKMGMDPSDSLTGCLNEHSEQGWRIIHIHSDYNWNPPINTHYTDSNGEIHELSGKPEVWHIVWEREVN